MPLAIDELPLVALLGCFAEGETVVRGAQELRVKESDRIAGVVEGLRGLGADIEATDDGFAVRGSGGLRGGTIDARGDHRMAMMGAVAGLASREGVEVIGMEAAAVSYPGFVDGPRKRFAHRDRRSRRRGQVHRRARARRELGFTYLDSGAMYRCVALPRWSGARGRCRATRRRELARAAAIELGDAPSGTFVRAARRARRERGDPRAARSREAASVVAADPAVREALVAKQRALIAAGDWVAEGRDIGTVVAPDAELKVFLTADPRERARRRAAELGADTTRCSPSRRCATSATARASTARCGPHPVPSRSTPAASASRRSCS